MFARRWRVNALWRSGTMHWRRQIGRLTGLRAAVGHDQSGPGGILGGALRRALECAGEDSMPSTTASKNPRNALGRALSTARRYGFRGLLGGLTLRHHFQQKQLIIWADGRPRPTIKNAGRLETSVCTLFPGVRIEVGKGARLSIGKGTYLNRNTVVVCRERVAIGEMCQVSWDVVIMDTDEHEVPGGGPSTAPVTIGDRAWIGCRTIILKGVTIGEGAIVGAGAIVTKDVPPYTVAVGQPARVVRHLDAASERPAD
jgi:acetyltransferase-like isoleucine patch superfamily enzyme